MGVTVLCGVCVRMWGKGGEGLQVCGCGCLKYAIVFKYCPFTSYSYLSIYATLVLAMTMKRK